MPRFIKLNGIRFAPTPSGHFHLGNLRTAWVSWRLAQEWNAPWEIRIEDIDSERCRGEFETSQLLDLEKLGLIPSRIRRQSDHLERHRELFEQGRSEGWIYPCSCSRRAVQEELREFARAPHGPSPVYTGHCRKQRVDERGARGWRMRGEDPSGLGDALLGRSLHSPQDFQPSYPFACAIDDQDSRYAWIVRGADLSDALALQRKIQRHFGEQEFARVLHTRMVVREDGGRLEKRTQGVRLTEWIASGRSISDLLSAFEHSVESGLWERARACAGGDVLFETPDADGASTPLPVTELEHLARESR